MKLKQLPLFVYFLTFTGLFGEGVSEVPITYYPRYEVQNTEFEKQFTEISIPEDKVAFSFVRVGKSFFDFSSINIPREQCMTTVLQAGGFGGLFEERIKGIYGVALLLEKGAVPSGRNLRRLKKECVKQDLKLFVGLDYSDSKKTSNVYDMAKEADYITIYAPRILMTQPLKFPEYVKKLSDRAHKKNPEIKIEVCVPTATNFAGTQMLAEILNACSPYADRFGIYLNERAGSTSSAIIITAFLRNQNEALQRIATKELESLNSLGAKAGE